MATPEQTALVVGSIYKITTEHPALKPDRRKTYDWRARPVLAGTLFVVREGLSLGEKSRLGDELLLLGGYSHQTLFINALPETFTSALEHVTSPTPSQCLKARDHESWALEILDVLFHNGKISMDDIQAAETKALAEGDV